jgi:hypothetical protein
MKLSAPYPVRVLRLITLILAIPVFVEVQAPMLFSDNFDNTDGSSWNVNAATPGEWATFRFDFCSNGDGLSFAATPDGGCALNHRTSLRGQHLSANP